MTYEEALSKLKSVCRDGDNYRLRDAVIDEVERLVAENASLKAQLVATDAVLVDGVAVRVQDQLIAMDEEVLRLRALVNGDGNNERRRRMCLVRLVPRARRRARP